MAYFRKTQQGYLPLCEKGSMNDAARLLGYEPGQYYDYWSRNIDSTDIIAVAFKIFTTDVLFVLVRDGVKDIQERDVKAFLKDFNFSEEYNVYTMESDLEDGISNENLSIEFLAEAMEIPYRKGVKDAVLVSEKFKYRLYFTDGILTDFESSDGYNRAAKDAKESMPQYFSSIKKDAEEYWDDDEKGIINELNIQFDAFETLPDGVLNKHLKDFSRSKYSCNFKIVKILFYGDTCTLREFKDLCHGEAVFYKEQELNGCKTHTYVYKKGVFTFSGNGTLLDCTTR